MPPRLIFAVPASGGKRLEEEPVPWEKQASERLASPTGVFLRAYGTYQKQLELNSGRYCHQFFFSADSLASA